MEDNKEQEEREENLSTPPTQPEESNSLPSMAELLDETNLELEFPKPGEIKSGIVVRRNDDEILVGIGAKSEGIIPARELSQIDPEELARLTVGAEVLVYVVTLEDQHGNLVLSRARAMEEEDWNRAEQLQKSGEIYQGEISGYNKGGLIVKLGQLRGFLPASQVSLSRKMAATGSTPDQRWGKMVNEPIVVRVIEVDRERHRLIFSEQQAVQESREMVKDRLLAEISVGDEIEGRVTSLADFGAFVNINGADGLVHLTEISWERVKHPSEVLKVGQRVRVRVISIDGDRKRIGLSIRQLQSDPWPQKVASLTEGQLVQAKIVRLTKFGAFARLDNTDLEGLIHISELSNERVEHPKEVVSEGEELTLRILRIEMDQHRIGLSLRKVHSTQYADIDYQMAMSDMGEPAGDESQPQETGMPAEPETPAENGDGETPGDEPTPEEA
jgi:small subunit ribosomal protein S1